MAFTLKITALTFQAGSGLIILDCIVVCLAEPILKDQVGIFQTLTADANSHSTSKIAACVNAP